MKIELDALNPALERAAKEEARKAAEVWVEAADKILDRSEHDLGPIKDQRRGPYWDGSGWVIHWEHAAAVFHEYGTDAHTIRARRAEVLAFEWPDAPREIREQFEETYPTVFLEKTHVGGVPAARFVRGGRDAARRYIEL